LTTNRNSAVCASARSDRRQRRNARICAFEDFIMCRARRR